MQFFHSPQFFHQFTKLQLDIVGIVAILGEGSTQRNAQASALSWHHILPRIYPAPQALLKHHQDKLLPVDPGIVVGATSGRIRHELNFFTRLLHDEDVPPFSVQMLDVQRKPSKIRKKEGQDVSVQRPAMAVKKYGHLAGLSILGCCMSIVLFVLALWQDDGPALLADICLSTCSSLVGFASWSIFDVREETPTRKNEDLPLSDVIIFYPARGSFRVIHCSEETSRLYFRVEHCRHYFTDNQYRIIALFSSVLLMAGLIMLGNAQAILQAAFAASYILLNALYWASSALNPSTHVWKHDFDVKEMGLMKKGIKFKGDKIPQSTEISPWFARSNLLDPQVKFLDNPTPYINGNWKKNMIDGRINTFVEPVQGDHLSKAFIYNEEPSLMHDLEAAERFGRMKIKMLRHTR